jgi:hypothetical protein
MRKVGLFLLKYPNMILITVTVIVSYFMSINVLIPMIEFMAHPYQWLK